MAIGFGTLACGSHTDVRVQQATTELWETGPGFDRRFEPLAWDTAYAVGGTSGDTALKLPMALTAAAGNAYVYDARRSRLIALDSSGRIRWQVGNKGRGVREFDNVRDLKMTPTGSISVLDPGNERITWIGPSGEVMKAIPLSAAGYVEQHLPLAGGRTLLLSVDSLNPFIVIDSTGRVLEHIAFPWKGYSELSPIARQGHLASDAGTGRWAFTFTVGDGWFAFDTTRPRPFAGRYVVHAAFPSAIMRSKSSRTQTTVSMRIARPWIAAPSTALADSTLYVLYGGNTAAGSIVDRYSTKDGSYLGSITLPVIAKAITVEDERVYAIVNRSPAQLLALRGHRR